MIVFKNHFFKMISYYQMRDHKGPREHHPVDLDKSSLITRVLEQ